MNEIWTCNPDGYLEPRLGRSEFATVEPTTVLEVFKRTVDKHNQKPAMHLKRAINGEVPRNWRVWSWQQYWDDCRSFAKAMMKLGIGCYKVVNILGFNSPEWFIANTGSMFASCIAAGIYITNSAEACQYISEHSKAEILVVDSNTQLAKYKNSNSKLPHLKAIVVWNEVVDRVIAESTGVPVFSWDDFLQSGEDISEDTLDKRSSNVRPGNCSTLIYTSGTTGPPKAVMISHDNITWVTRTVVDNYLDLNFTDRVLSFLPLSHIAAQTIDLHGPMTEGFSTYFAQPDALKGSLTVSMKDVHPTIFFGVPRVWEKIQEKMMQIGRETTGIKKNIATWAKAVGSEKSRLRQYGESGGAPCGYGCANSLVLSKIKAALGLDQAKGCFSAAAPIAPETILYFASLDIPIYEIFGQSECTGPHTFSNAINWKVGYCGRPLLGTETKIVPENGELCYRGRHIFMGYMYMPKETAETIDSEGYLHSGDVAEFDGNDNPLIPAPSGFLRITGRIKELIITAGGENIPPVLIENEMKAAMLALSNCMVVGDRRKFLSMLVSLKVEVDVESGEPTDRLSQDAIFVGKQIGSNATTMSAAANDPLWIKYINDGMKIANSKTTSSAQNVQKWKMLPVDFSEKAGLLTPTLKLKRNVAAVRYADLIDSIYADTDNV